MSELLDIHVEQEHDVAVVSCRGEIDIFTREPFEAVLRQVIAAGHAQLIVDMRGVDFLDSSGLCSLLLAIRSCEERRQELRIVPSRTVRDICAMAGMPSALFSCEPGDGEHAEEPAYPPPHWRAVLRRAQERLAARTGPGADELPL